jgi:hypothetical protein
MMPVAVRQVFQDNRLGHESNEKPALCIRGTKHAHCVVIDFPVRVLMRPAKDFDTLRPTPYHAGEYPVLRMIKHLLAAGRRNGITLRAARLIEMARTGHYPGGQPFSEDPKPNEEEEPKMETTQETSGEKVPLEAKELLTTGAPEEAKMKPKKVTKKKASKRAAAAPKKEAKRAKATADGLGREGTAGRTICVAIMGGATNEAAVKKARKEHPGNKIADNYGAWYRNKLTKEGLLKAAK